MYCACVVNVENFMLFFPVSFVTNFEIVYRESMMVSIHSIKG
jgi:hypothetical protein